VPQASQSTPATPPAELSDSVRRSFPELELIGDVTLREQVVEVWALALSQTEFTSVDQLRGSGKHNGPVLKGGTQATHLRGVALMALGLADALEAVAGPIGIDRDLLIACALCHDVGKPFEFSPRNRARWEDPAKSGSPAIRHPAYGAHLCLMVGLPEAVAHTAGNHSRAQEAEGVKRSLENTIVAFADHAYWRVLDRAHMLEGYDGPGSFYDNI
jgi:putative nucleotidyltransferase with HDIG domain